MDNLFELDIIDSLGVVELILYMEEQRGQEVDLIEMDPEVLFTLGGIRHFISGHE